MHWTRKHPHQGVASRLVTRHNRRIGTILPAVSSAALIPRKASGPARTRTIARHDLTTASTIDELLNEEKGLW